VRPCTVTAPLLHRLEQRGLRLGRRAVDLVGEHHVREHRPAREHHPPLPGGGVLLDDVGAGDVARHQVGGELDAREAEVERARERVHEQRLRQPGDAHDEAVAAREERDERLLDHALLPDDELAQLAEDLVPPGPHPLREGDVVGGGALLLDGECGHA
jgi:hypothetical protein